MTAQITVVFNPPLPTDAPDVFDTKAFDTLSKINTWAAEANELADDVNTKQIIASDAATTATQKAEATELDATATAADRAQTVLDAAATSSDLAQTQLDRAATTADRAQTEQDRQAVADAIAAIEGGPVATVNTKPGPNVVLNAADVGAIAATSGVATGLKHKTVHLGNISGATAINLATAGKLTATLIGHTALSFTNPPGAGQTQVLLLRLTNAGAFNLDWPAGTLFDNKKKEALTAAGADSLGLEFDPVTGACTVYVIGLNVGVAA